MIKNVNRIVVVGGPGTGKSTLTRNLGKDLNLPIYHLDGLCHLANWEKRDRNERDKMILEKTNEPKWVIDGTYKATFEERVKKSDLIIFLNYSTIARLKGIFSRYFEMRGQERPEIPGCKEKMSLQFLKFAINWDKKSGNFVKDILEKNQDKKVIVFKKRKQLNSWYETEFNKKIEV